MIVRSTSNGIQVVVYKSEALSRMQRKQLARKKPGTRIKRYIAPGVLVLVLVIFLTSFKVVKRPVAGRSDSTVQTTAVIEQTQEAATKESTVAARATAETDQSSVQFVVNKKHALEKTYEPSDLVEFQGIKLRKEAMEALQKMMKGAQAEDYVTRLLSGYRSYEDQTWTYQQFVNQYGVEKADTFSARPGHSEHQTGLALDIGGKNESCDTDICFGKTPLGLWINDNAYKYGFIVRYQEGKESLTGYQYEPWHLRYVGVSVATELYKSGLTLDQYYGVEAGGYK